MIKLLLTLLAAGKLGKVLTSGGTMLLSVGVYALVYGWRYAVGLVAMLVIHEGGHYVEARRRGLAVSLPTFVPFVGAWIQLKDAQLTPRVEAAVAFAGPLAGTVGAFAAYALGAASDAPWLLAVAYAGFLLNLVNLIPVTPLDGGRITALISPRMWWLGVPLLVALMAWKPSPVFLLVALFAAPQIWRSIRQPPDLSDVGLGERAQAAALYLGLVFVLGVMTWELHETLSALRGVGAPRLPPATT